MAELKVRFYNIDSKTYLENLSPISWTADFSKSFTKICSDASKIDYTWIKSNVLDIIEQIYNKCVISTVSNLMVYIFDDFNTDFFSITLNYIAVPIGSVRVVDSINTSWTRIDELFDAAKMISANIATEIGDILLRGLSTSSASKTAASVSGPTATTSPSAATGTPDLDALCDQIKNETKADVVKPKETLADYVCSTLLMQELTEIKDFFDNASVYKAANVEIPKGILFKGAPGTGKTYAARCIAGSVDVFFMTCTASALQGMYIGSGAENIRNVFKGAKKLADASKKGVIVFIDEIDSFGSRENHGGGAGGEEDRTVNQLLAEMSGFTPDQDIMVIAATNYPDRLDSALMRSGRFDRQITIEYPNEAERLNLISHYFGKKTIKLEASATYDDIASLTNKFTPADIAKLANESAILAVRNKHSEIMMSDVDEAINRTITKEIRHPDKDPEFIKLVTAHECGHAIAHMLYNKEVPIKVVNYSYGDAGGFTQGPNIFGEGLPKKEEFVHEVKILLAGRAAEQVICNYITVGASSDLDKARKLLTSYYKTYNFRKYDVSKLEQIVLDDLHNIYEKVVEDLKVPENLTVLNDMISELNKKRTLYALDCAGFLTKIKHR